MRLMGVSRCIRPANRNRSNQSWSMSHWIRSATTVQAGPGGRGGPWGPEAARDASNGPGIGGRSATGNLGATPGAGKRRCR
jgi:hypothetical protein